MRRKSLLILSGIALGSIGTASVIPSEDFLIWNRTESAPLGLYWQSDGPLTLNAWAVVSANSPSAEWAAARGYIGTDWPIIKQVRGIEGDVMCRDGNVVSLNGDHIATALKSDGYGRDMPVWQGCFALKSDEVFLLNDHPDSLDGRYFGASKMADLRGTATLLWRQ